MAFSESVGRTYVPEPLPLEFDVENERTFAAPRRETTQFYDTIIRAGTSLAVNHNYLKMAGNKLVGTLAVTIA